MSKQAYIIGSPFNF